MKVYVLTAWKWDDGPEGKWIVGVFRSRFTAFEKGLSLSSKGEWLNECDDVWSNGETEESFEIEEFSLK